MTDTSSPNPSSVKKDNYYRINSLEDAVKMLVNQISKAENFDIPNLLESALYLQYGDDNHDWTVKVSKKQYIKSN